MSRLPLLFMIGLLTSLPTLAATYKPDKTYVYKTVDEVELQLFVFNPDSHLPSDRRPVIVFFFGGGWVDGTPRQFFEQADYFAKQGMVAIAADYRVKRRHKVTPFACVRDGKSAIRWVRMHADELGIDVNRVVASGGSAGGHVAACTGIIQGNEEDGEDLSVSSVPNAMILFNPVLDTTAKGYGASRFTPEQQTLLSPIHHVRAGIAPTLVLHGTADSTVPFENAERFTRLMKAANNDCTLVSFPGQNHGFFNGKFFRPKTKDLTPYRQCIEASTDFLRKLKYLEPASE